MEPIKVNTPEPVRKAGALQALGLAVVNVVALVAEFSGELTAALNGLVAAVIVVVNVFWLRPKVTPMEGPHDRLLASRPPETPDG